MARYSKKWFNPLYFILNDIVKDESVRTVLVFGGKSSSKTISICQVLAKESYEYGSSTIAYRKQSSAIPTTLKKSFNLAVESLRYSNISEIQDRRYLFKSATNKTSEIVLKGIDDPEKAKGIESYKYLYLDELNHFDYEEYESFNLSLRGIKGQKIFASWNPVDKDSWVKKKLVDSYEWEDTEYKLPCEYSFVKRSTCGKVVLIRTTYEDNYWINGSPCGTYGYKDENLISEYKKLEQVDNNSFRVNVLGEWGEISQGENPFCTTFDVSRHVSDTPIYDKNKALFISIDFNLVPFCATFYHYWSDSSGEHWHLFDEVEISKGSIPAMIDYIKNKYSYSLTGATITGDAMGNRGDISQRDNASLYLQIIRGLGMRESQVKVSNNPTHQHSRTQTNLAIEKFNDFKINKNCTGTIRDLKNVQVDAFGSIIKKNRKDMNQRGDFIDTVRYFVHNIMFKWIEQQHRKR